MELVDTSVEHVYFLNVLFVNLHSCMILMVIYCRYRSFSFSSLILSILFCGRNECLKFIM